MARRGRLVIERRDFLDLKKQSLLRPRGLERAVEQLRERGWQVSLDVKRIRILCWMYRSQELTKHGQFNALYDANQKSEAQRKVQ